MDCHRRLYKESSRVFNQRSSEEPRNRKAERAKKRGDVFLQNRGIPKTPIPSQQKLAVQSPKEVSSHQNKQTHRQAYIEKFIAWKKTKLSEKLQKVKPAYLNFNVNKLKITVPSTRFAAKNDKSKPAELAKQPSDEEPKSTTAEKTEKRCSIYIAKTTPTKVHANEKLEVKLKAPPFPFKKPNAKPVHKVASEKTILAPKNMEHNLQCKPARVNKEKQAARSEEIKHTIITRNKSAEQKLKKDLRAITNAVKKEKPARAAAKPTGAIPKTTIAANEEFKPTKRTAPPNLVCEPFTKAKIVTTNALRPPTNAGIIKKAKRPPRKATEVANNGKVAPKLSRTMKAKAAASNHVLGKTKTRATSSKNSIVHKRTSLEKKAITAGALETPIDLEQQEHFPFITSTKIRNVIKTDVVDFPDSESFSPVKFDTNLKSSCPAKRSLVLQKAKILTNQQKAEKNVKKESIKVGKTRSKFLRSFVALSSSEDEEEKTVVNNCEDDTQKAQATVTTDDSGPMERASNYLSPFVTVSRGKVNARSERLKRDSIYLKDINSPIATADAKEAERILQVNRTTEAVIFFRKQHAAEVDRLYELCKKWNDYLNSNIKRLQETGGDDMINAAVGQTNLLINKKLKQFAELIDRCEVRLNRVENEAAATDVSEAGKPVLVDDLQGWWDMVKLQSDNIDKRFVTIERWQANNWEDPDASIRPSVIVKKRPAGIKKSTVGSKAKPSSGIQQLLRQLHADMRKNKATATATDQLQIFCNRKSPRPSSVPTLVHDRKAYSPVPTTLMLSSSSKRKRSSVLREKRATLITHEAALSPKPQVRHSILRTPGSTKAPSRRVSFSAKKFVRKFVIEAELSDDELAVEKENMINL